MKYNININQLAAVTHFPELDIIDIAIYEFIREFFTCSKKMVDSTGTWYWISNSKLIEEMPILKLTTRQSIYRRINKLIESGLLERHDNNSNMSKAYYRIGVNSHLLVFVKDCKKFLTPPVKNELHNNNTNDYVSKDTIPKNKKPVKEFSQVVNQIYEYIFKLFPEETRPENDAQVEKWKDTLRKFVENDKKDPREICEVVRWARGDSFWSDNFLSILKLRKKNKDQVMYYNVFLIKLKRNGSTSTQQRAQVNQTGKVFQKSWDELDEQG